MLQGSLQGILYQKNHYHYINCSKEGEFVKLLEWYDHEVSIERSHFLLEETIMRPREVKRVILVDYTCIPRVVTALCGEPMASYESIAGEMSNSAVGQNYTNFCSMHNYTPF